MSLELSCCLCDFTARVESDLEVHIDSMHSDIFLSFYSPNEENSVVATFRTTGNESLPEIKVEEQMPITSTPKISSENNFVKTKKYFWDSPKNIDGQASNNYQQAENFNYQQIPDKVEPEDSDQNRAGRQTTRSQSSSNPKLKHVRKSKTSFQPPKVVQSSANAMLAPKVVQSSANAMLAPKVVQSSANAMLAPQPTQPNFARGQKRQHYLSESQSVPTKTEEFKFFKIEADLTEAIPVGVDQSEEYKDILPHMGNQMLENQIAELEHKLANLENLQQENTQLKLAMADLETTATNGINQLSEELGKTRAAKAILEAQALEAASKTENLLQELQTVSSSNENLEKELANAKLAQEEMEGVKRNLNDMSKTIMLKNSKISQVQLDNERLLLEVKKFKKECTDIQTSISTYTSNSDKFIAIKAALKDVIIKDSRIASLQESPSVVLKSMNDEQICKMAVDILQNYVDEKHKLQYELNQAIKSMKEIKDVTDTTLKHFKKQAEAKTKALNQKEESLKDISLKLEISLQKQTSLQQTCDMQATKLSVHEGNISKLRKVGCEAKKLMLQFKTKEEDYIKNIAEQKSQIKIQQKQLEQLKTTQVNLTKELNDITAKMKSKEAQMASLQGDIKAQRTQSCEALKKYMNKLNEMKNHYGKQLTEMDDKLKNNSVLLELMKKELAAKNTKLTQSVKKKI